MLPLTIFRSRQFSGANAATLANYIAIGAMFFFLSLQLQDVLGYTALAAGAASLPATVIMLGFSAQAGRLGQRIGPRIPMTVGPIVLGVGLVMLAGIEPGDDYLQSILPGVIVFGIGMTIFVAPLTTAVLGALPDERAGIASAVNNAVARLAQLLASAALPAAAGLSASIAVGPGAFSDGYHTAMLIAAAVAALGGLIAWVTIRGRDPRVPTRHPSPSQACTSLLPRVAGGGPAPSTIGRMSPIRPTVQLIGTRLDPAARPPARLPHPHRPAARVLRGRIAGGRRAARARGAAGVELPVVIDGDDVLARATVALAGRGLAALRAAVARALRPGDRRRRARRPRRRRLRRIGRAVDAS